jgi:AP2-associated kinase
MVADGTWVLCDFGSTRPGAFVAAAASPEEIVVEEDTIRKHTTPAYRAPEVGGARWG